MSDITDQLAAATEALSTATTAVEQAVTDLNNTAPTVADNVLSSLVTVLTDAGYVVTAPSTEAETSSDAAGETSEESASGQ